MLVRLASNQQAHQQSISEWTNSLQSQLDQYQQSLKEWSWESLTNQLRQESSTHLASVVAELNENKLQRVENDTALANTFNHATKTMQTALHRVAVMKQHAYLGAGGDSSQADENDSDQNDEEEIDDHYDEHDTSELE
jgi:hypothetical protein